MFYLETVKRKPAAVTFLDIFETPEFTALALTLKKNNNNNNDKVSFESRKK